MCGATLNCARSSSTTSVWGGEDAAARAVYGAERSTQVPVVNAISYGYDDLDAWYDVSLGKAPGHIYGRNTNPTVGAFERKLAALEGAPRAIAFASGMAAVSNTLFTLLAPGDKVVSIKDAYGGTSLLFLEFLPRLGVEVELLDTADDAAIGAAIAAGCDVLYLETPTNPTLKLLDIAALSAQARAVGATVVVDNTFATPLNQSPLSLGADLVLHSASKYLGGHADAMGGVLCGDEALVQRVYHYREITGACLDPHAAYLLLRGMKTLALRVAAQNANALAVARWLEAEPRVEAVHYPGLESHPQHALAARQMHGGFGGMLSFTLTGGWPAVRRVLPRLELAHLAANLGPVETVVGPPRTTSHVECTPEERAALGIDEGLVRYSAGIEETEDLLADLQQAFEHA